MSSATTYVTKLGDQLDWICWKHYGTTRNGVVEAVLGANTGLAEHGTRLPAGLTISLPAVASPAAVAKQAIKLWD